MYGREGEVKLIDFGLSKSIKNKHCSLKTMAGTPYYMAPEMINGNYGPQCDVWSIGVLMYFLLSGRLPFKADTRAAVFNLVKSGVFSFNFREFDKVSQEAKSLIRKILVVDPSKRLTPEQILQDPFFTRHQYIEHGSEAD